MSVVNNTKLIGRLVRDPELRQTSSGKTVINTTIAVDRPRVKEKTDFIEVVIWGAQAEYIAKYAAKGTLVAAEGVLTTRSWTAEDGSKRRAVEVQVEDVKILSKPDSSGSNSVTANEQNNGAGANSSEEAPVDDYDEELPF